MLSFEPLSLRDKSRGVTHGETLLKQKIYQKHAEQAIALFTRWSRLGVKVFKRVFIGILMFAFDNKYSMFNSSV